MAKGFQGTENKGYIEAMRGLRSSNAAQPHTPKSRKGTRSENKVRAIREY